MIHNDEQYRRAEQELEDLAVRLKNLQTTTTITTKGFTKAGIRKLIARLHEELGEYEGNLEAKNTPAVR